jgi:3-methyl-2-oxobutanoate hydroxymethyltransferase
LEDAIALQEAGCFAIVLEAIPESVATMITERINVPTIGIGAGPHCSGQVLVQLDLLGVYDKLAPKFCKIYSNIGSSTMDALKRYGEEVKSGAFPESETHTYKMLKGHEELLKEWISKTK